MSTANKLTYLNETKSQLKTMISKGLETPLSNETFRQYVNALKQALINSMTSCNNITWNNLPKVTGSGTSITLNNVEKAPMQLVLNSTNIIQGANPSPSNPQDIHVIKGNNNISVCGKNLFHDYYSGAGSTTRGITRNAGDNYVLLNGTYNKGANADLWFTDSTNSSGSTNMTLLKANTTYTVTVIFDGTHTLNVNEGIRISSRTLDGTFSWNYQQITYSDNKWTTTFTTGNEDIYLGAIRIPMKTTDTASFTNTKVYIQVEKNSTDTAYEAYNNTSYSLTLGDIEYCKINDYEDKFIRANGNNLLTFSNDYIGYTTTSADQTSGIKKQFSIKAGTYTLMYSGAITFAFKDYNNTTIKSTGYQSTGIVTFTLTEEEANRVVSIIFFPTANTTITNFMIVKGTYTTHLPYEPYGNGQWYIKKNVGKINSYNGETITTPYMSTTGGLDTGATVYYGLTSPTYTLVSDLLQLQLEAIYNEMMSAEGQTNISQTNADLSFNISASALEG